MRCVVAALLALMLASCEAPVGPVATEHEFGSWIAEESGRAERFARFEGALRNANVADVVPAFDLWMMDRLRRRCMRALFVEPPEESWDNIVATLRFIRDHVEPAVGEVRVVSAYRDEAFNVCVGGARACAHRGFYAVDLIPMDRRGNARVADRNAVQHSCARGAAMARGARHLPCAPLSHRYAQVPRVGRRLSTRDLPLRGA
jgi:hypothetical protein